MNLPEPTLPEHELIRSAAELPRLSAGLRDRVLRECAIKARRARIAFRVKVAGSAVAVCCVLFLLLSVPPQLATPAGSPGAAGESSHAGSSGSRSGIPSTSIHEMSPDAMDETPLPGTSPRDMQQLNRLIEDLQDRERRLNCALLPFL